MTDILNRFWIPVAQILPVFILGLVVEARFALRRRSTRTTADQSRWDVAMDRTIEVSYALIYVLAMVLLVLAFAICLFVMVAGKTVEPTPVFVITLGGVVLTGLLPVVRLLGDRASEHLLVPLVRWVASRRKRA